MCVESAREVSPSNDAALAADLVVEMAHSIALESSNPVGILSISRGRRWSAVGGRLSAVGCQLSRNGKVYGGIGC